MKNVNIRKTYVEIDKANFLHNLANFRKLLGPDIKLMSIIKSNAYGHGLLEMAKIGEESGYVDWFGADSIEEGIKLRENGVKKPILILGYTMFENIADLAKYELSQVVANEETLIKMGELEMPVKVHLKIETGTSRQGIAFKDIPEYIRLFKKYPHIELEGLSTHYANIEDTTDHSYAKKQLEKYQEALHIFQQQGIDIPIKHTACSAAAILFPETRFDLARIGISQYGLWSSKETFASAQDRKIDIELKPVLTWKTVIAHIKDLPAGTPVSYGLTEKLTRDSKVAVLPIGYWDGYDRKLSSVGNVLVNGKRCKIIGRICMNMCVIDITDAGDVKLEDEVTLLGRQGEEEITAEEIASKIGTINYEVVTRINPTIKRIIK